MRREDRLEPVFFLLLLMPGFTMQSKEDSFRSFTCKEELERAKWFKQELDEVNGWSDTDKGPGVAYWSKLNKESFPLRSSLPL